MKKIFAFLFVSCFLAFAGSVNAGPGGDECEIITVYCGDEPITNLITCGSDNEKMAEVDECLAIFCN